jgi:hypothetical protein
MTDRARPRKAPRSPQRQRRRPSLRVVPALPEPAAGSRVRDTAAGRRIIATEIERLRAWCEATGAPWRAQPSEEIHDGA